jgi:hypothetical protein
VLLRQSGHRAPPADKRPTRFHAQAPKCALDKLTFDPLFCANYWKAGNTNVGDLILIQQLRGSLRKAESRVLSTMGSLAICHVFGPLGRIFEQGSLMSCTPY